VDKMVYHRFRCNGRSPNGGVLEKTVFPDKKVPQGILTQRIIGGTNEKLG